VNPGDRVERVPIHTDGVVRVADTRVTLDTMLATFDACATAEEIAQQSSICVADENLNADIVRGRVLAVRPTALGTRRRCSATNERSIMHG